MVACEKASRVILVVVVVVVVEIVVVLMVFGRCGGHGSVVGIGELLGSLELVFIACPPWSVYYILSRKAWS